MTVTMDHYLSDQSTDTDSEHEGLTFEDDDFAEVEYAAVHQDDDSNVNLNKRAFLENYTSQMEECGAVKARDDTSYALSLDPATDTLVSGHEDGIRVWSIPAEMQTRTELYSIPSDAVLCVKCAHDEILSATEWGAIAVHRTMNGKEVLRYEMEARVHCVEQFTVTTVHTDTDGATTRDVHGVIFAAWVDDTSHHVSVLNRTAAGDVSTSHGIDLHAFGMHATAQSVFIAGPGGVSEYDHSLQKVKTFTTDFVCDMVVSGDTLFACGGKDIKMWDIATGTLKHHFTHSDDLISIGLVGQGTLVSTDTRSSITFWDLAAKKVDRHEDLRSEPRCLAAGTDTVFLGGWSAKRWRPSVGQEEDQFAEFGFPKRESWQPLEPKVRAVPVAGGEQTILQKRVPIPATVVLKDLNGHLNENKQTALRTSCPSGSTIPDKFIVIDCELSSYGTKKQGQSMVPFEISAVGCTYDVTQKRWDVAPVFQQFIDHGEDFVHPTTPTDEDYFNTFYHNALHLHGMVGNMKNTVPVADYYRSEKVGGHGSYVSMWRNLCKIIRDDFDSLVVIKGQRDEPNVLAWLYHQAKEENKAEGGRSSSIPKMCFTFLDVENDKGVFYDLLALRGLKTSALGGRLLPLQQHGSVRYVGDRSDEADNHNTFGEDDGDDVATEPLFAGMDDAGYFESNSVPARYFSIDTIRHICRVHSALLWGRSDCLCSYHQKSKEVLLGMHVANMVEQSPADKGKPFHVHCALRDAWALANALSCIFDACQHNL